MNEDKKINEARKAVASAMVSLHSIGWSSKERDEAAKAHTILKLKQALKLLT